MQPTNLWKTAYIKNQTGELWRDERLLQAQKSAEGAGRGGGQEGRRALSCRLPMLQ